MTPKDTLCAGVSSRRIGCWRPRDGWGGTPVNARRLTYGVGMVRVLLVDDQPPFRLAARAVVEATDGFEVVGEAENGEASVELARGLRPDLVLMDVNLPGIDRLAATRQLLR